MDKKYNTLELILLNNVTNFNEFAFLGFGIYV